MPASTAGLSPTQDPSVDKQWDASTPIKDQFTEFYAIADTLKICLLTTHRPGVGLISRSMQVARRNGPDFLFIANANSSKFKDLHTNKDCEITFQNSGTQDWISISGTVTTADNSDPRIKDLYSPALKAWFGDLGDGIHEGTASDPRMALIEVKARYITYWKTTVSKIGYLTEVAVSSLTGRIAQTGVNRKLGEDEIEDARREHDFEVQSVPRRGSVAPGQRRASIQL